MRRYFRRIYQYWMAFGHAIGTITTPIMLSLVYLVALGPARMISAVAGKDLLEKRFAPRTSFWHEKEEQQHTLEETRRQF